MNDRVWREADQGKGRFWPTSLILVGGFAAGRFDWRSVWWWPLPLGAQVNNRSGVP
jgi:hypothetical protein